MPNLTTGITADGNSEAISIEGGYFVWSAGGTFGSGTLKLQYDAGSGWCDVTDATMTESGTKYVALPSGRVRVNMASSTSPDVYSDMNRVPYFMQTLPAKGL